MSRMNTPISIIRIDMACDCLSTFPLFMDVELLYLMLMMSGKYCALYVAIDMAARRQNSQI